MPTHYWGDDSFDWKSLYLAEIDVRNIVKLARIGIHSKEKYGTLRWDFYFCDGSLHSLTHPGYMFSQYPKWLWRFDVTYEPLKFIAPLIRFFQKKLVMYAFHVVCSKYPNVKAEIIEDAPINMLPPTLALEVARMWSNSCKHCGKMSTTDNYICPHCGNDKNNVDNNC
jgi:hypothetical protein